jgi:predicted Fe-Mo cluster-binding NifX family protein
MLESIPTNGKAGLENKASNHFGSVRFLLYDSTAEKLEIVENRNAQYGHGTCYPLGQLAKYHIDCIVCSGMSRRAIEALGTRRIRVIQSKSKHVRQIFEEIKADALMEMYPGKACQGRGQGGGFMHGSLNPGLARGGEPGPARYLRLSCRSSRKRK